MSKKINHKAGGPRFGSLRALQPSSLFENIPDYVTWEDLDKAIVEGRVEGIPAGSNPAEVYESLKKDMERRYSN